MARKPNTTSSPNFRITTRTPGSLDQQRLSLEHTQVLLERHQPPERDTQLGGFGEAKDRREGYHSSPASLLTTRTADRGLCEDEDRWPTAQPAIRLPGMSQPQGRTVDNYSRRLRLTFSTTRRRFFGALWRGWCDRAQGIEQRTRLVHAVLATYESVFGDPLPHTALIGVAFAENANNYWSSILSGIGAACL